MMVAVTDVHPRARTSAEWEELYLSLRPNLTRALVAASGAYEGVEDAIQEAFAKGIGGRLERIDNLEGWLFTVALNSLRRSRRRARLFTAFSGDPPASSRELDMALERNDTLRAMRELPERERTLLIGKYYVGLTQEELARVTGLPRGTVSAAISRATALLREREEGRR